MISLDTIKSRSISGVVGYSFRTVFIVIIGLVTQLVLSSYLTPADYGIYAIVLSLVSIFTFLSDIGLAASLIQKETEPTTKDLRTVFTVQNILSLIIVLLVIGLTPFWKAKTGLNQSGLYLLYALGLSYLLSSLRTISSILMERKLEFNRLVIPQILENIAFNICVVIFAIKGYGINSFTIGVVVRSIVGLVSAFALRPWPVGIAFSPDALKNLLKFGFKFQLNDLLSRVKDQLLTVFLATFMGKADLGYVSWAQKWPMYPYQFGVANIINVTFSTFSRLQDKKAQLGKAAEKVLFFICLIIFPTLVGLAFLAKPLVILQPRWHQWLPALPSLYLFCINIALASISTPFTNILNAIGHINKTLYLMIFWTLLTWGLTPLGIHYFGFTGVALASALVSSTSFLTIYLTKKVIPLSFFPQVYRQVIASLVMGIYLYYFQDYFARSWYHVALAVLSGSIIYIMVMMIVGFNKLKSEIIYLFPAKAL